jgi:hypothetical protein
MVSKADFKMNGNGLLDEYVGISSKVSITKILKVN